jgi:pimeloyl-ACP methyl ester carboxylesterase
MSDDKTDNSDAWLDNYSRRDQHWIHDKFIAAGGLEDFFPESVPFFVELGYRLSDLDRAFDGAKNARMGVDEIVRIGDHHLDTARKKEANGHKQSAFEYYHRSALCYIRGSWSLLDVENPDKVDWHNRGLDAYAKMMELNPHYEIEKVDIELPFHNEDMAAYFHKSGHENAPTLLNLPGMDLNKEETPNPANNRFVDRGMNVLTIDGPGQGETRLRGIAADDYDTYQRAGSAAIDWLVDRPEVDSERIGVLGVSMGSYWGPRIAVEDDRVSALASHMGCWYSKDLLFNQAQPFFKKRFMYMADKTDEEKFDEYMSGMTLAGLESEIDAPTFLIHGEYDELQTREQAKKLFERLPTPKRLDLYENQFHPIGGAAADILCDVADWFEMVWNGDIQDSYSEANFVADYPDESYVPSPQFEFLDQDERPSAD